jgi:predicted Zn-dependent protease with MMP-like domain
MEEVTRSHFEELVRQALDEVPGRFAKAFEEVAVVVEDYPPPGQSLYGLYQGVPLTFGDRSGHPPPHISIYMHPLVDHFRTDADLVRQVRITVLHELGHHLGMDEDQLEALGYG